MQVHCPLCNTTEIVGQGSVLVEGTALVQYRCIGCGELFFSEDRRNATPPLEKN